MIHKAVPTEIILPRIRSANRLLNLRIHADELIQAQSHLPQTANLLPLLRTNESAL